jgi:hypothetical protein
MKLRYILLILAFTLIPIKYQSADAGNPKQTKSETYQFKNDSLVQTIIVKWQIENRIKFEYSVKNTKRNKIIKVSGVANNPYPDMDPENDEDELDGLSYASIQYISEQNGCYLSIRIELDNKNRVVVMSGECPKYFNPLCPLASQGVLRIKK